MDFPGRLKSLRNEKSIKQTDLCALLSVSQGTIGNWETGIRMPDTEMLGRIADYFGVTVDYLLGRTDIKKEPEGSVIKFNIPTVTEDFVTFPVIGEIAAGYDVPAIEDWSGATVDIPVSYLHGRDRSEFIVLEVHGDSMYPLYMDGDIVLVLRQTTLNRSGEIGAVMYDGDAATLKKIEYVTGEDWMKLIPVNPNYPPKLIEGPDLEECRVLGIPKLVIREINE